jgi:hypothetical protein
VTGYRHLSRTSKSTPSLATLTQRGQVPYLNGIDLDAVAAISAIVLPFRLGPRQSGCVPSKWQRSPIVLGEKDAQNFRSMQRTYQGLPRRLVWRCLSFTFDHRFTLPSGPGVKDSFRTRSRQLSIQLGKSAASMGCEMKIP